MILIIFKSVVTFFICFDVDSEATNTNGNVVLEEVLEEAPKWKVLRVSE